MKKIDAIIKFHGLKEYQSREYCRDIDCPFQRMINEKPYKKELTKEFCHRECDSYQFHLWLKDNGYKIVKKE